jgi:DinB family protein
MFAGSLMPAALKEASSDLPSPETERRAAPLSAEDQAIQSMPDASPIKWHRAHTTWFFETFLVQPNVPGYRVYDERFAFLFNSYYVAAGPRHARPKRGLITRPNAAEVAGYRGHVDAAVERLIAEASSAAWPEIARILEIGLNHEEQHQELMLTDVLHAFAQNPTNPAYDPHWQPPSSNRKRVGSTFPRASTPSAIRAMATASIMKGRRTACCSGR